MAMMTESGRGQEKGPPVDAEEAPKSQGSLAHPDNCVPCAFYCYSKVGCNKGQECTYCHEGHQKKTHRRRHRRRKLGDDGEHNENGSTESPDTEDLYQEAEQPEPPTLLQQARVRPRVQRVEKFKAPGRVSEQSDMPMKVPLPGSLLDARMNYPGPPPGLNFPSMPPNGLAAVLFQDTAAGNPNKPPGLFLPRGAGESPDMAVRKNVQVGRSPPPSQDFFFPPTATTSPNATLEETKQTLQSLIARCSFLVQAQQTQAATLGAIRA